MSAAGVVVLLLTATPWVARPGRDFTYFEVFGAYSRYPLIPLLMVLVLVFAGACLSWWLHRSPAAVLSAAVAAATACLAVASLGDAAVGVWLTLLSCLLTAVVCVIGVLAGPRVHA